MITLSNEHSTSPYHMKVRITGEGTFSEVLCEAIKYIENSNLNIEYVKVDIDRQQNEVEGTIFYRWV